MSQFTARFVGKHGHQILFYSSAGVYVKLIDDIVFGINKTRHTKYYVLGNSDDTALVPIIAPALVGSGSRPS